MTLAILWFFVIGVLWIGFFVLEGFDFGVGMLHQFVGADDHERRVAMNTIGPVWDGNEVWLITAGAAMFAAFPMWYATMFSGFYLALVLVLVALILRGVSFEFRAKRDSQQWRSSWSWLLTVSSLLLPLLIGCALANLLHGLPIDASGEYTGSFWTLLHPYCLLAGVTVTLLCLVQGATFLALKTEGAIRDRSRGIGLKATPVAALVLAAFALWTWFGVRFTIASLIVGAVSLVAVLASWWYTKAGRDGWAFILSSLGIAAAILCVFVDLYPNVMISSTDPAYSLTVENASSASYTLTVMSIVTLIFLPIVLLYQGWTFFVFRRRLSSTTGAGRPRGTAVAEALAPTPAAAGATAGSGTDGVPTSGISTAGAAPDE
jgi:cytochrome d ubiquinol oxidase subunit II